MMVRLINAVGQRGGIDLCPPFLQREDFVFWVRVVHMTMVLTPWLLVGGLIRTPWASLRPPDYLCLP